MSDPKEPKEFSCFDSNWENNGWGYNSPEPECEDADFEIIEDENTNDGEDR